MLAAAITIGPSFFPACIGAAGAIAAALIGWRTKKESKTTSDRVERIEVNVDGRLTAAMEKIDALNEALGIAKSSPAEPPARELG
jgi:hypothetical protein